MHFRKMETSALIREVKRREILWNNSHDRYFHKTKKKLAWIEVCEELFANFAEYDDVQQKTMIQDVMGRWRTIRDNFVRKRKRDLQHQNSEPSYTRRVKKYIFEDELSFLNENKGLDRRSSTYSNHSNLEQISQSESFLEVEETPSLSTSFLHLSPKREQESPVEDKKLSIEAREERPLTELDPFDEDLGFFISLLPTVKSLNRLEKLDFRIKTMQLLQGQLSQPLSEKSQENSNGSLQRTEFSVCGSEANGQMFLTENY